MLFAAQAPVQLRLLIEVLLPPSGRRALAEGVSIARAFDRFALIVTRRGREGPTMATKQSSKICIFLGAGATASGGAPTQAQLLPYYARNCLSPILHGAKPGHRQDRLIRALFSGLFDLKLTAGQTPNVPCPTFEELLGMLDIGRWGDASEWRRLWMPAINRAPDLTKDSAEEERFTIDRVHQLVTCLFVESLEAPINKRPEATSKRRSERLKHYTKLLCYIHAQQDSFRCSFVTTNYDRFLEAAAESLGEQLAFDYGVNFNQSPKRGVPKGAVQLLKLHGSVNWLLCPRCGGLEFSNKTRLSNLLKWHPERLTCGFCEAPMSPFLIPPTYFKVLEEPRLRKVWKDAEETLCECDTIVFSGYSFPDADVHVRYLLKKAELRRDSTPKVFVANWHPCKNKDEATLEKARYERFFKDKSAVRYCDRYGFAELPCLLSKIVSGQMP
jgi:NAD-dependent SIR2 family protein deacetylase